MSDTPPPSGPQAPGQPVYPGYLPPQPQARSVSFYVAIFLALLLLISGGLNLLLLLFSAIGSASPFGGGGAGVVEIDGMYQLVQVAGDRRAPTQILRVPISGAISEQSSLLIGASGGTVSQVRRALRTARRNQDIKAVLLDINSPGGGVTDSDEVYQAIREFRQARSDVKVLALFGDTAASGGYYIAMACDRVMARPTSITGSIGVIISQYNVAEAMKKLGVSDVTIVSPDTPFKNMLSPTQAPRPEDREKVLAIVQEMYERFVDIVVEGRPEMTRERVRAAANGQIYSALQARELGLVDAIGGAPEAQALLAEMIGAKPDELAVLEQRRIPSFFETMFGSPGLRSPRVGTGELAAQLLRSTTGPRFLYFWPGGR